MAHPLNRPRLDPEQQRVVEGYAILQPRVTPSLPIGQEGSLFLRVFSSASGIDPDAAAVSDVYQDLFGEGSYTGKGIYDIDAFEAAIAGRVPDSRLLSHDLFEGIFARAGLASDVEVVEAFPARYDAAALRHHRWARGDWQLLPWMTRPRPRRSADGRGRHGVPMVGRWKMLDNLRRTLSAPSTGRRVDGRVGGATTARRWSGPASSSPPWPAATAAGRSGRPAPSPGRRSPAPPLGHTSPRLRLALIQLGLMLVFLGHQAWLMGDAIAAHVCRASSRAAICWNGRRRRRRRLGPAPDAGELLSPHGRRRGRSPAAALACAIFGGGGAWPARCALRAAWTASPAVALGPVVRRRGRGAGRSTRPTQRRCADREAHLALLRDLRDGRVQLPCRRQLPGNARAGGRAPHLADQHRPLPARRGERP